MQVRIERGRTEGLNLHVQGQCFNNEFPMPFPHNIKQ